MTLPEHRERPGDQTEASQMSLDGDGTSVRRPMPERGHRAVVLADPGVVTVKGRGVFEALRAARFRPIFVGTVGGFCLDRRRRGVDRLPDILAALEHAGFRVEVAECEWAGELP